MKITVVGAILIIAGVIIAILFLSGPPNEGNRGPQPNNLH
jgi:hypothetical protein